MKDKVANGGGSVNGEKLNFRVGPIGSALPMVFFIIWAIVCSMFDIANEQSLIVGAVIGLGLGLFVCKDSLDKYLKAVTVIPESVLAVARAGAGTNNIPRADEHRLRRSRERRH